MKFDWRVSAIAAGAAFVLSFLVGVLAGVSFGAILVRAVLGALLFGAGAAGALFLLDRFIPELRESLAQTTSAAPEPGGSVDIVVDDDIMVGDGIGHDGDVGYDSMGSGRRGESGDEATGVSEDVGDVEELEAVDNDSDASPGGIESDGAFPDETRPAGAQSGAGSDDDGVEVLEEVPPEAASAGSLPDIEGMAGSFSEGTSGAIGDLEPEKKGSSEDTAMMARAIQTVLKREG